MEVISDMTFFTNEGREFGPFGKCRKGYQPGYTEFRNEYPKTHVRLDKLDEQVRMTSQKYQERYYAKSFKEMGKFYNS